MKFNQALLAACVSSLVRAAPAIVDEGNTQVSLRSNPSNPNGFEIDVTRTDTLSDEGVILAERVVTLGFEFNVIDDNLLINDQIVSTLGEGPKATIVKATFVREDVEDPEKLVPYFSQGLVNVEIASEVENFLVVDNTDPTGAPVLGRHVTIHEKILEVDGNKVRQSAISEHVIDVYSNGTIIRSVSDPSLDNQVTIEASGDDDVSAPCDGSRFFGQLADPSTWSDDDINKAALCGFSVAFSFAFLYFILALVRRRRQTSSYTPLSSGDCPPGYNAKDAAIFSSDLKKPAPAVTEVTESEERITVLQSLTSDQD